MSMVDHRLGRMVARSDAMRVLFDRVRRFAASDAPVLVVGETGTGKELVARALHDLGPRAGGPFVPLNCGALPHGLVESELFGHERGAFTGAVATRTGAFEQARGGTLFLDEVGELALEHQARLLRALESGAVRRVGGGEEHLHDARVVSATHRDLPVLVAEGRFRADLWHRLAVLWLVVPPLRERPEDVMPIAEELLRHCGARAGKAGAEGAQGVVRLGASARAALLVHDWPGNVRELRNALVRAVALRSAGGTEPIEAADLALGAGASGHAVVLRKSAAGGADGGAAEASRPPWHAWPAHRPTWTDMERLLLEAALTDHDGNKSAAARALGISRSGLRQRMARLGLLK